MIDDGQISLFGVLCFFLPKALDLEQYLPLWFPMRNDLMIRDSWLLRTCGPSLVLDQVVSHFSALHFQRLTVSSHKLQQRCPLDMVIRGQCNIRRMKMSQSVLSFPFQRYYSWIINTKLQLFALFPWDLTNTVRKVYLMKLRMFCSYFLSFVIKSEQTVG